MYAIIRLRGSVGIRPEINYTLKLLRLHRVNHCVVVEENDYTKGMLQKVKDYVAWGEVSEDVLDTLIKNRGRLEGGKSLTDEYVKAHTSFGNSKDIAHALITGSVTMKELATAKIKPIFRLHPPRKGLKGIKRSFQEGGELGYHGDKINDLLLKMR